MRFTFERLADESEGAAFVADGRFEDERFYGSDGSTLGVSSEDGAEDLGCFP